MGHQGDPNGNFHHYTQKNSELAKNWPKIGPQVDQDSRGSPQLHVSGLPTLFWNI